MAWSSPETDLEQQVQARRMQAIAAGWPLVTLASLGAVGGLAATPAATRLPVTFAIWAAAVIALALMIGWLARAAPSSAMPAIRRLSLVEALCWAAGLAVSAWLAREEAGGTVAAAGAAVLMAPLLAGGAPWPGARARVALLGAALIGGGFTGAGAAALPHAMVIAALGAGLWLSLHRRERASAEGAERARAREGAEQRILRLLGDHEGLSPDWTWTTDGEGRLLELSPPLTAVIGGLAEPLHDDSFAALFEPGPDRDSLTGAFSRGEDYHQLPLRLAGDGTARAVTVSGHRAPGRDGGWRGHVSLARHQEPLVERIERMAHGDAVTGLANREALMARLRAMLAGPAHRDGPGAVPVALPVALFVLDLDDFRSVNDTLGPDFGDALLRAFANRLGADARCSDLVARLGGNRFALAGEAAGGDSLLIGRAHRLLAIAREPFELHGASIRLSTSIGLARGECGMAAPELLRRAELALHGAKARGRDRMAFYEEPLDRGARDRRQLESELREALEREELAINYQPVIALATGETVAFEALLRWNHPTRGPLMPDRFLPVAEESGLIVPLGSWVLRRALEDVAHWDGSFRLAINLSPSQTRDPRLAATIEAALAMTGFPPARLELEITEHVLFDDADRSRRTLERLRALGVRIALDDFGTGYSSLSYLRRFRFDRVKIDRVFVSDIEHSDEARAIVSTITRLAQALDIQTTAEGVEDARQLDLLRKLGCDEAQGFLIHHPVEAGAIAAARAQGEPFPGAAARLAEYREGRRAAQLPPSLRRH